MAPLQRMGVLLVDRVGGLGGVPGPSDRDPTVPERRATRRGVGGL